MRRLTRRTALRSAATGALVAPLLWRYERALLPAARAQDALATGPKRLVIFWNPQGNCSGLPEVGKDPFWPTGSEQIFTMSRILKPLERHQQDLLILRGFDMPTGNGPHCKDTSGEIADGAHGVGTKCTLTAVCPVDDPNDAGAHQWGGGHSLDQEIARAIGGETFRESAVLSVAPSKGNHRGYINYAGPGLPIAPINEPLAVYRHLFGDAVGASNEELLRLRAHRASALDLLKDEATRLRERLPAAERIKMDQHLEALRGLEREFDHNPALCESSSDGYPAGRVDPFPVGHDLQFKTIAAALACDTTRVVSLMAASGGGDTAGNINYFGDAGAWPTNYHSTGHASGGSTDGGGDNPVTRDQSLEIMTRVSEFYADQVAKFVDALKAIPEGEGSVFDNTVILWCSEMAHGNHSGYDWPFVILGGKWHFTNGYFFNPVDRGGRYDLKFKWGNILLALAHAMGHPIPSFGFSGWSDADPSPYQALWKL
jgi:hypothetical protein